jgi:antirestriction protein ArdC
MSSNTSTNNDDISAKKETYPEKITREMISMLENGTAPFIKPWEPNTLLCPHNPATGTVYKGFNAFYLSHAAAVKGYSDPRWMTFVQIKNSQEKLRLNEGSKGVTIAFFQPPKGISITDKETGENTVVFPAGIKPIYKYSRDAAS